MTMKELAKLVNVSVSTVSKAFGGAHDVNPETRERIFEAARKTGCYNKFYKGKYPKKIIAVICREIISSHYTNFVERLRRHITDGGNIALLATDNFDKSTQEELIDYFSSYLRVDGIIVFSLASRLKKSYDTPIVSIFSSVDERVDSVNIDVYDAIDSAVELLVRYGHRDIAFIGEGLTAKKAEAFEKFAARFEGINTTVVVSDERFELAGKEGADRLLDSGTEFSALICAYDNIALGAIKQLKNRGLSVPHDVSVIGMDNIITGEYAQTSLTTIGVDVDRICKTACDILEKKFKNPYYKAPEQILIKGELILRESVDVKA